MNRQSLGTQDMYTKEIPNSYMKTMKNRIKHQNLPHSEQEF